MALVKLRLDPTPREQRQFAALWFPAFFALLGGLFLYSGAPLVPVLWVWGVVAALSLAALASATFARSPDSSHRHRHDQGIDPHVVVPERHRRGC